MPGSMGENSCCRELEKANPVHFGLCIKTEEQKKHKIKSFNATYTVFM